MRITDSATYRTMLTNMDRIDNKLFDLRTQGTTNRKLNKASDNPTVVGTVLDTRNQLQQNDLFTDTLNVAGDSFAAADTQMSSIEDEMVRAKQIALAGNSGSSSEEDRTTYAHEVGEIIDEMVRIGNTKISGEYIFGGYNNDKPPFVKNPDYDPALFDEADTTTWPVQYRGDNHTINLEIAPGERLEGNVTGNELFMGVSNESFASDPTTPSSGGKNLFNTLAKLQKSLVTNDTDTLTNTMQKELDMAAEQNRNIRAIQGVRANHIDSSVDKMTAAQTDLKKILSRYQDADAIEVYSDIVKQEGAFKAALQVTSRISRVSVLDYL